MARPITYLLPVYWACALVNDDYTGLSDEEKKANKRFSGNSRRPSGQCEL